MKPSCVSVIGWSGSGKTTLIAKLLPALRALGLRVAALKHSTHEHVLLKPGSDTDRLAAAGASWVGFATPRGLELFLAGDPGRRINGTLEALAGEVDLVLIEGWKAGPFPKIEVWQASLGPCLSQSQVSALAVVTDDELATELPKFRREDIAGLSGFLAQRLSLPPRSADEGVDGGPGVAERPVTKFSHHQANSCMDLVAVEEPLEIRVAGEKVAITMRTPGDDARLAVGFLFAEGIIRSIDDVGSVVHCGRPDEEGFGNVIDVSAAPGVVLDVEKVQASRRGTLTTSACGVCGRRSVDDLLALCGEVPVGASLEYEVLATATDRLKKSQHHFARTGGTHAAAALTAEGVVLASFEDVGRHNAVDKVVGELLMKRVVGRDRPFAPHPDKALRPAQDKALRPAHDKARAEAGGGNWPAILVVSGRASIEIVQKATVARIPAIASVSAASSLAVDLARRSGITLVGFVREGTLNVYTHPERIVPLPPGGTKG